jgi:hypothetical protein
MRGGGLLGHVAVLLRQLLRDRRAPPREGFRIG